MRSPTFSARVFAFLGTAFGGICRFQMVGARRSVRFGLLSAGVSPSLDSSAEMYGNSMGILSPSLDCSRSTKVQAWTAECWSESEIDFC